MRLVPFTLTRPTFGADLRIGFDGSTTSGSELYPVPDSIPLSSAPIEVRKEPVDSI